MKFGSTHPSAECLEYSGRPIQPVVYVVNFRVKYIHFHHLEKHIYASRFRNLRIMRLDSAWNNLLCNLLFANH